MANRSYNIKLSTFGYNKNQVNRYIERLDRQRKLQLEEIKEDISIINTENEVLERKLKELKYNLDMELKQQRFIGHELNESDTDDFLQDSISNETTAKNELLVEREPEEYSYSEFALQGMDDKKEFEVDQNVGNENNAEQLIDEKHENYDRKSIYDTYSETVDSKNNKIKIASSFWGEDFEEFSELEENLETSEAENKENIKTVSSEKTIEDNEKLLRINEIVSTSENYHEVDQTKEPIENVILDSKTIENKPLEHKDMQNQIVNIRSKYLIGKIVGEDLMDGSGKLLAKNGLVITEDLIEKVDIEGKLPELILNMILPETSE
jgi:nitrogenase molybdenum-iron protein alpha/beta subunit